MEGRKSTPAAIGSQRERTIETLVTHFAADHITVEEFERRVDLATRALVPAELDALLSDLPVRSEPAGTQPVAAPAGMRAPVPAGRRSARQFVFSLMSGTDRRGAWRPAERIMVFAAMGGASLDFREAIFEPGVTDIDVFCAMGGVEIIVPPTLAVETSGFAIMGGFESRTPPVHYDPDQPLLRIRGIAIMGGVEVEVRRPGESARDAKARRKLEARQRRSLPGG
jgi:hypothetical protein